MENSQNIPSWLQWVWTGGAMISVFLAILAVIREFPLIKCIIIFCLSPIKWGWAMLNRWLYGLRYSPKIKVTREPTNVELEYDSILNWYKTEIEIEIKLRDMDENTEIDIEKMKITLTQGRVPHIDCKLSASPLPLSSQCLWP